jgi:hypothetical protein
VEFRPGQPTYLDDALIEKIISNIPRVFIMKHVAQLSSIPNQTLNTWMMRGKKEIEAEIESIYTKLYIAYHAKLSEALSGLLEELKKCRPNYGAIVWILEHCYKKEFMTLPEDVQKIIDWVNNHIKPMLEKGGSINGEQIKEMDSEGDQTSGCLT